MRVTRGGAGCALLLALLLAAGPAGAQIRAPDVPQPRAAGDLVGLLLTNPTGQRLPAGPVTFGQVFAPGQVPAGATLTARINGAVVPVQTDAKATHPDGSLRMAVVTLAAPALGAGAAVPAMLALAPASGPAAAPVDLAAAHTGLVVTIALAGVGAGTGAAHDVGAGAARGDAPRVFDVDALLHQALAAGHGDDWLHGPLASEARVDVPVASSLHLVLDIRRDAAGTHTTDLQFNNDLALQPVGGEVTYDVTIARGGQTVFARQNLHQFQYTAWHREIAERLPPVVVHDVAYLERAGAIIDYNLAAGVPAASLARETTELAKYPAAFDVLGSGGLMTYMGATGGRADIGPTTEANAIWLITQNPAARAYALAQDDAAGSIPWHYFDPAAGTYLTTLGHPDIWTDPRGGGRGSNTTGLTQPVPPYSRNCGCWSLDAPHQPDLAFIPYLLTGSRHWLDEMTAQAAWDVIGTWPGPREGGRGIVVAPAFQVRGIAWNLRGIDNAAYALPDAHKLKAYFVQVRATNYAALLAQTGPLSQRQGEAYGWMLGGLNGGAKDIAPWQQDYLGLVVAQAAKQGVAEARQFLQWESNFLVGRFLAERRGFSPYDGSAYEIGVIMNPGPDIMLASPGVQIASTWADIARLTRAMNFSGCPDADMAHCGWGRQNYPQYRQQGYAVVAEIGHVLALPEAKAATAWLTAHVDARILGPAQGARFSIAPLP
jgi:hypothetical protein